ncbi:hypothetical protein ACFW29_37890 [Streptomyces sp. NPDC058865]
MYRGSGYLDIGDERYERERGVATWIPAGMEHVTGSTAASSISSRNRSPYSERCRCRCPPIRARAVAMECLRRIG